MRWEELSTTAIASPSAWVDIVSAIATAGAVVVALFFGGVAEWRATSARRSAQATLVAGWMTHVDMEARPYPEIVLRMRNASKLPIYDFSIEVDVGNRGTFVWALDAVGPGETREFRFSCPGPPRGRIFAPRLMFSDVAEKRWLRGPAGKSECLRSRSFTFTEDPGAYDSIEAHPTLPSWEHNGDPWKQGRVVAVEY